MSVNLEEVVESELLEAFVADSFSNSKIFGDDAGARRETVDS